MFQQKPVSVMVYSHWLSPGPEPGSGRMGCMVLKRTFHTAPKQGQAPEQGKGRMGYVLIFQVLKLFQVVCFNDISMVFKCAVLAPDTASVNGFYIISVPVLALFRSRRQPVRIHQMYLSPGQAQFLTGHKTTTEYKHQWHSGSLHRTLIGPKITALKLCSQSNDTCVFPFTASLPQGWKQAMNFTTSNSVHGQCNLILTYGDTIVPHQVRECMYRETTLGNIKWN